MKQSFLGRVGFIYEHITRGNIKYGLLVRTVTESTSGYILNLEIYAGEGKKLQETIFTLFDYLDKITMSTKTTITIM